jgi:pimeloyl-ACP methyl ester carboxylesterase
MSATEVHSPGRDAAAGTADMTGNSQYTAPTLTIDAANGTTYAHRRFGRNGAVPVVFRQHFRGNLDNWDPALVYDIGAGREVILVDNSGVGLSTGSAALICLPITPGCRARCGSGRLMMRPDGLGRKPCGNAVLTRPTERNA